MEACTCRPDIAFCAAAILDTYRSRTCGQSSIDRRRIIDPCDEATQQAGRRPQHVDCARAEHAYRDAEPETRRRSSKSAEINDRDRFKRHARVLGVGYVGMLDVGLVRKTRLTGLSALLPPTAYFCLCHVSRTSICKARYTAAAIMSPSLYVKLMQCVKTV